MPHPLQVGSIWRKWDLHLHAPTSVFNNQFPHIDSQPDWETYLAALESQSDISVIGITDYFSIDGYKKVKDFRDDGRLKNFDLILPNIELRLDAYIPTSKDQDNSKVKKVNAHVIFADSVSVEDIEDHFLRELKFAGLGRTQDTNEICSLSRHQLEQFGSRLKEQQPTFEGSPYQIGCKNAAISFDLIKKVLKDHGSKFDGKYLIFIATENLSLISWEGQGHNLRKIFIQGSDGIFGGQDNDRLWALGRKGSTREEFEEEFGCLKPCLHGSDAHSIQTLCKPAEERFCWIKGDPTFEGLKQVIFEPEDRVFIGDELPTLKHPHRILIDVSIENADSWFAKDRILLNQDLVSIIGGKGAGKSALAELIAYAGGSEVFGGRKSRDLEDTFLRKASRKSPSNPKPIVGATVTLGWADGGADIGTIKEDLNHGKPEEKVKYLPQKFVERICAPENSDELLKEIERVIFYRLPKQDRLNSSTFSDLREQKTKSVRVKKNYLAEEIEALNREVFDSFQRVSSKKEKERALQDLRQELSDLQKNKPGVETLNPEDLDKLTQLQTKVQVLESEVASLNSRIAQTEEIGARMSSMKSRLASFNEETRELLLGVGLEGEFPKFEVIFPTEYINILKQQTLILVTEVETKTNGLSDNLNSLTGLRKAVDAATAALQLSRSKRAAFEKFEKDRLDCEQQVAAIEKEIQAIENEAETSLVQKRKARVEKYLDYFDILKEEKLALDSLYTPISGSLEQGGETDKKLVFSSKLSFDTVTHAQRGIELFDSRRRGRFKDTDSLHAEIKKIVSDLEGIDFDRELAREVVTKFREVFLSDSFGEPTGIGDQLRKGKTEEDFNNWFFDLKSYRVNYSITFEGRDISLLSPGQKGIVLLLVYLEIDREDQRPLIIDQPEDNLDNLSVYSNLIEFFRKKKLYRQIILITHNPNLVVNTDSEQIMIASYNGTRAPRIQYESGALEQTNNNPPGIREQVCAILEGGTEAFQRREQKYDLQ